MPVAGAEASRIVLPQQLTWQRRLVARFIVLLSKVLVATWRQTWTESPGLDVAKGPVIFCVWHNRLAIAIPSWNDYAHARWPANGMTGMISASRDGAFLAAVVRQFGIQPIRGSTSRRGPQALLEATTWLEKNYHITITPDGPRGPVYHVQDGIIHLAQVSGRPIVPTSTIVNWKIQLRSWDRFQVPLPFAKCEMRHGELIWVPRDATPELREQLRSKLETAMHSLGGD